MNRQIASALALSFALAACGKAPGATDQPNGDTMDTMSMPATAKAAKGVGTITAIDSVAGTVTFDHGPVVDLRWPALTMGFSGQPDMLKGFVVGDKVAFVFDWNGRTGMLVSMTKR